MEFDALRKNGPILVALEKALTRALRHKEIERVDAKRIRLIEVEEDDE